MSRLELTGAGVKIGGAVGGLVGTGMFIGGIIKFIKCMVSSHFFRNCRRNYLTLANPKLFLEKKLINDLVEVIPYMKVHEWFLYLF